MKIAHARFQVVSDAPLKSKCPNCLIEVNKQWEVKRTALDCSVEDGYGFLQITVGVFHCSKCSKHFRNQPVFIRPKALYTNRVANVAIASVIEDGMPISKVSRRLEREYGISPSESTIRGWISNASELLPFKKEDYSPVVNTEFSGVICIDEAYSGSIAMLVACDPINSDRVIGYCLEDKSFSSSEVKDFLLKLKAEGIDPEQVVTDESALYPKVIIEVWPKVKHQLCLFHMSQKITKAAKKCVQKLKSLIPKPPKKSHIPSKKNMKPIFKFVELNSQNISIRQMARDLGISRNTVKRWRKEPEFLKNRYGIDAKSNKSIETKFSENELRKENTCNLEGWKSWDQITEANKLLNKIKFKISSSSLSLEDWNQLIEPLENTPIVEHIQHIRNFINSWRKIWWQEEGKKNADINQARLQWEQTRYFLFDSQIHSDLEKFRNNMTDHLFSSLSTFFDNPKFQTTNNSAERSARSFKKLQKNRYKIRSKNHLKDHLLLSEMLKNNRLSQADLKNEMDFT